MLSNPVINSNPVLQADIKTTVVVNNDTKLTPINLAKEALEFVNKLMPYGAGNKKSSNTDAKQAFELANKQLSSNQFIADEAYAALGIKVLGGSSKHMSMLALIYLCMRYPNQDQYGFKFFQLADMDHCLIKIIDLKTNQELAICDPWLNEAYLYTKENYLNSLSKVSTELGLDIDKVNVQKEAPCEGDRPDGLTRLNKIRILETFLFYHYQLGGQDDGAIFSIHTDDLQEKLKSLQKSTHNPEFDTAFDKLLNQKVKYFSGLFGLYTEYMSLNEYLSYSILNHPLKAHVLILALEQYKHVLVSGQFVTENYAYFYTREPNTVINCLKLNKTNDKIGAHIVHDPDVLTLFKALENIAHENISHNDCKKKY